jgi:CBS domain-containing protein
MRTAMKTRTIKARNLMKTELVTLPRTTSVGEAEQLLVDHGISGAPVTDAAGEIIGLVSIRDILDHRVSQEVRSSAKRMFPETYDDDAETVSYGPGTPGDISVADIMTAAVYSVDVDADLQEIAREMTARRIHRVLVRDETRCVGLISSFDVLEAVSRM